MIVAVNWLNRLAIHFEEFCQRIDPDCHFSPAVFTNPPLDNTHKFRSWFLDLWNTKIVLTLRDVIKMAQVIHKHFLIFFKFINFIFFNLSLGAETMMISRIQYVIFSELGHGEMMLLGFPRL